MNGKLLQIALSQYGVAEIPGKNHNPEVLKYFTEIGHSWVKDDETSWCSAFMNWVAMKAGAERSGKLDARSWLAVGEVKPDREPDPDPSTGTTVKYGGKILKFNNKIIKF